ncbi:hypothetical protein CXF59_11035 [Flavobacterium sp. ALD4]|uniref:DUF3078 domain-containing protein n=1 Tax=Flavobacterium sp. ALD4 TaxID=2058314 RepID=UPI000C31C0E6|nr:DUF3078 domain-containing protein [Flavobacterium sp. ALD4]PKH66476.1 hypothetical protein CXF59_11035 [Flavobacterium sp. ALD4]
MKLLPLPLLFFVLLFTANMFSQKIITTLDSPKKIEPDTLSPWVKKNKIGFDISEIAFINWNAGGTSSISGLLKGKFNRTYSKNNYNWTNELIVRYGLNKQDGIELRKTEDVLQFNSALGYRQDTLSNWYHTAKLNFNTQFTDGYAYPNKEISISRPFAPAYIFLGLGAEYATKDKNKLLYLSPFTSKITMVLDQILANQGAFGVKKALYDLDENLIAEGEKSKVELGFLLTGFYKQEIFKNITLENRLSLYSDYINKFGNVDLDYDLTVELVVNEYVKTNIGLHIIYDDDIKAKEDINGEQVTVGPKTQLKQVLGVGIVYSF